MADETDELAGKFLHWCDGRESGVCVFALARVLTLLVVASYRNDHSGEDLENRCMLFLQDLLKGDVKFNIDLLDKCPSLVKSLNPLDVNTTN